MMMQRRIVALAAASAAALLLGACSGQTVGQSAAQSGELLVPAEAVSGAAVVDQSPVDLGSWFSGPPEPVKDSARGMLPSDPYYGNDTWDVVFQAEELIMLDCMHQAGYPDETPRIDKLAPRSESRVAGAFRDLFNEELAAKYGYHWAPNPQDTLESAILEAGGSLEPESEEWEQTRYNCWDYASENGPNPPAPPTPLTPEEIAMEEALFAGEEIVESAEPLTLAQELDRLWLTPESVPALVEAAAVWRECMAPLEIVDLPEQPWTNMYSNRPPESLQIRWEWESPIGKASADEIAIAVHDAQCQTSSGWAETLYSEQWDYHQEFIERNKEELAPILADYEAQAQRALAIIDKYSGA